MQNWKRVLVLVALTTAVGFATFAVEDEVNAQSAGSAGAPAPTPGSGGSGGSTAPSTAGTSTTDTSSTKKDDGGCSVAAPMSRPGLGALIGLGLGLALFRRRKTA
jgi:MYXO-CTERM domain-containing protein